ncbi:sulfite exporter TauE/SafE family protein [Ilumatobacter nonamiensis]|uniref:sulfite exporter TauE/SafE family protein n=1 Tax=Ilumatobacter nonamiensis TaxID=467093 RepID=UPI000684B499|nr:sulfite exporter TauE/SafE family protein [Ilumatobacter nonamiensis]
MTDAVTSEPTRASVVPWKGLIVGAAAGLLSGLFGIGGGIVIVPALLTLLSMDRRLAHGTSLAATVPVAAASLVTYAAGDHVDWTVALFLAIGAIAGAVVGTQLLQIIPKRPLTIIFVVVIVLTAVRLLIPSDAVGRDPQTTATALLLIAIGFITGTLAGLLGIGGGVVLVPAMVVLFSMPPVLAKGTSVAVILPSSIVGTLRNRSNRNVDLRVGIAVGASGVIFAVIGGLIARSLSATFSNATFAVLLVIVAAIQIRTLWQPDATPSPSPNPSEDRANEVH